MKKRVWIDTDTGVDDACALLMALQEPSFDVVGVSAVCGNVPLERTYPNARNVLALAGREDIPVYRGAQKPLMRDLLTASLVHGANGLGGVIIPDSTAPEEEEPLADALYRQADAGELWLITLGPLTNIAQAFLKHPDLPDKLAGLYCMGGGVQRGNVTASAEFNIIVDPEAAELVFSSRTPVTMFGLDVTETTGLGPKEREIMAREDNRICRFVLDMLADRRYDNDAEYFRIHDANPVAGLAHPEWFTGEKCGIHVETRSSLTLGKTITDIWSDAKFEQRIHTAQLKADIQQVNAYFLNQLVAYSK